LFSKIIEQWLSSILVILTGTAVLYVANMSQTIKEVDPPGVESYFRLKTTLSLLTLMQ
jgi:hypothetical protein